MGRGRPEIFKISKTGGSGCRGSIRLGELVWLEPFFYFISIKNRPKSIFPMNLAEKCPKFLGIAGDWDGQLPKKSDSDVRLRSLQMCC